MSLDDIERRDASFPPDMPPHWQSQHDRRALLWMLEEETNLLRTVAVELESMNERHGCGQIECSHAMDVLDEVRKHLGLKAKEPF